MTRRCRAELARLLFSRIADPLQKQRSKIRSTVSPYKESSMKHVAAVALLLFCASASAREAHIRHPYLAVQP